MDSSVHIDHKGKDILILGEGPTQGLDATIVRTEAKYPINFTQPNKRFVLSLRYNGSNSFLLVNATKKYRFKANNSEMQDYTLCSGTISKDFTNNDMKKTQINGRMMVNVDVSVKNVKYVKKIIFRILLHVVVKMENI